MKKFFKLFLCTALILMLSVSTFLVNRVEATSFEESETVSEVDTSLNNNINNEVKAVTRAATFTITYNANGGTGSVTDATAYAENSTATVKDITGITNPGFVFTGWNTAADGNGDLYMDAQPVTMTSNITLFAQWAPDLSVGGKLTLTYDANGGTGSVIDATEYDIDTNATVKDITGITKTGFVFTGWNTAPDGSGDLYMNAQTIVMMGNITLFAQWAPDLSVATKFNITYDVNGGTGTISDAADYDENAKAIAKAITGVTKIGFAFIGWNTVADGSGTVYAAGSQITMTQNITLFAQWRAVDQVTIIYDANGGLGIVEDTAVYYVNDDIIVKDGTGLTNGDLVFVGWNTRADGSGKMYAPNSILNISKDTRARALTNTTLFAQWAEKVVELPIQPVVNPPIIAIVPPTTVATITPTTVITTQPELPQTGFGVSVPVILSLIFAGILALLKKIMK